jgi:hypothetical protein
MLVQLNLTPEEANILYRDYLQGPCDELDSRLYPNDVHRENILNKLKPLYNEQEVLQNLG